MGTKSASYVDFTKAQNLFDFRFLCFITRNRTETSADACEVNLMRVEICHTWGYSSNFFMITSSFLPLFALLVMPLGHAYIVRHYKPCIGHVCIHTHTQTHICCLVAKSCLTLCDPVDCSLPGSSVHVIFQARILEWVVISFSKGSSQPTDRTHISCIGRWVLYQ